MKQEPIISVIVPTWNRAYCLWKNIVSIQNQTYPFWELIIVDDNSSDDTYKLIREFSPDKRIKYFKNKYTHSPAGGRKTGLEYATGDFIAYLDSDNTAYPRWLEVSLEAFERNPKAMFAFPEINFQNILLENETKLVVEERSNYAKKPSIENLWSHDFEGDPNGLVHRTSLVNKIQGWDTDLSLFEDYDYSLQLAVAEPEGFLHIPLVLVSYTRLYGEVGICNDATYNSLVENINKLKLKYIDNDKWKEERWYDEAVEYFLKLEDDGYTPIQRIKEKYDQKSKKRN